MAQRTGVPRLVRKLRAVASRRSLLAEGVHGRAPKCCRHCAVQNDDMLSRLCFDDASESRALLEASLPGSDIRFAPGDTAPTDAYRFRKISCLNLAVNRCDVERRHLLDLP